MASLMICPRCWGSRREPGGVAVCAYCGGQGTAKDVELSPHFSMSEMVVSQTAIRRGIPNAPSAEQTEHLQRLSNELLEPIRAEFGALRISSGVRLPALNEAIQGSSRTSAHQVGWAADFIPAAPAVKLKAIVDWVSASALPYDQIIYEGTWVHVARFHPDGRQVRKQSLMMFPSNSGSPAYSAYDPTDPRVL